MRRVTLFALVLGAAISVLIVTSVWYLEVLQAGNASMNSLMGQMKGGQQNPSNPSYMMPSYFWILAVSLVIVGVAGALGLAYYLIFPQIRYTNSSMAEVSSHEIGRAATDPASSGATVAGSSPSVSRVSPSSPSASASAKQEKTVNIPSEVSWPVLIKTSKPDERKVLELLAAHGGIYLQKLIVKESGLSKLRVHRIVARLEERGILKVVESGNTNQVSLADWLQPPREVGNSDPHNGF